MKQRYADKQLRGDTLALITEANTVLDDYRQQGYVLTLRQLFYALVSQNTIVNTEKSYKKLGDVISDGRLSGLIDWDMIEDRTRNLQSLPSWDNPQEIVTSCAEQFRLDLWGDQRHRVECWVEKEALAGIIKRVCEPLRVNYIACRGYMSQSEMRAAGQRFIGYLDAGQLPVVLHLGDHDPSGLDMGRDIEDRLRVFTEGHDTTFERLALNMDQVRRYSPPPNPAKIEDSRFTSYARTYGTESWELDALKPSVLVRLIRDAVDRHRDAKKFNALAAEEDHHREKLNRVASRWDRLVRHSIMK